MKEPLQFKLWWPLEPDRPDTLVLFPDGTVLFTAGEYGEVWSEILRWEEVGDWKTALTGVKEK